MRRDYVIWRNNLGLSLSGSATVQPLRARCRRFGRWCGSSGAGSAMQFASAIAVLWACGRRLRRRSRHRRVRAVSRCHAFGRSRKHAARYCSRSSTARCTLAKRIAARLAGDRHVAERHDERIGNAVQPAALHGDDAVALAFDQLVDVVENRLQPLRAAVAARQLSPAVRTPTRESRPLAPRSSVRRCPSKME